MTKLVNKKNEENKNYSLGLDIGTNSVGWAIVALDGDTPKSIVDVGSRIFIKAVNDKIPTPKNADRRLARAKRRVIARRSARCSRLENYLKKLNLLPRSLTKNGYDRESTLNELGCPYYLRHKALDFQLEKHEIGRVLLHLVQRRGFLSNKKTMIGDLVDDPDVVGALSDFEDKNDNSKEASEYKISIAQLKFNIAESGYRTLGEYLYCNKELVNKRNRAFSPDTIITDRSMYLH